MSKCYDESEYVVRTGYHDRSPLLAAFGSEEEAHRRVKERWADGRRRTVHKLGPAIDPPEPREYMVRRKDDKTFLTGSAWGGWPTTYRTACDIARGSAHYEVVHIIVVEAVA